MSSPEPILECPVCKYRAAAYQQQIRGQQSIVCPRCGAHFYSMGRPPAMTRLPRVEIERFIVNSPTYAPYRVPELEAQVASHSP